MQKKRVCIFSYFDEDGKVGLDTIWLIKKLKEVSTYLIFVSNGQVDDTIIQKIADYILIRNNTGLDGGAYKAAMKKYKNLIYKCDELILCNSTFFGPFISFQSIIEDMEQKKCDFYGLVPWRTDGDDYIQSYFLIFKDKVFKSEEFKYFFEKYISEKTDSYAEICFYFERELQYYLKRKGFKSDTFISDNMPSPYEYPYESLIKGVPIIKKKCFNNNYKYCDKQEILNCLSYIYDKNEYNIEFILNWINMKWKWNLTKEQVILHKIKYEKYSPLIVSTDRNDLEKFYESNTNIYIYGAGKRAIRLLESLKFNNMVSKIRGFLVSDICDSVQELDGFPVFQYGEKELINGAGIIIALNTLNSDAVSKNIKYNNVLYLTRFKYEDNK